MTDLHVCLEYLLNILVINSTLTYSYISHHTIQWLVTCKMYDILDIFCLISFIHFNQKAIAAIAKSKTLLRF